MIKFLDHWLVNLIVGIAIGVTFCAWFVGATSEQVALIRLPATLILAVYLTLSIYMLIRAITRDAA